MTKLLLLTTFLAAASAYGGFKNCQMDIVNGRCVTELNCNTAFEWIVDGWCGGYDEVCCTPNFYGGGRAMKPPARPAGSGGGSGAGKPGVMANHGFQPLPGLGTDYNLLYGTRTKYGNKTCVSYKYGYSGFNIYNVVGAKALLQKGGAPIPPSMISAKMTSAQACYEFCKNDAGGKGCTHFQYYEGGPRGTATPLRLCSLFESCPTRTGGGHTFAMSATALATQPAPTFVPGPCDASNESQQCCSAANPCAAGEGGCNTDTDCNEGLYCATNAGFYYGSSVPLDACAYILNMGLYPQKDPASLRSLCNSNIINGDPVICATFKCSWNAVNSTCFEPAGFSYTKTPTSGPTTPPPTPPTQSPTMRDKLPCADVPKKYDMNTRTGLALAKWDCELYCTWKRGNCIDRVVKKTRKPKKPKKNKKCKKLDEAACNKNKNCKAQYKKKKFKKCK